MDPLEHIEDITKKTNEYMSAKTNSTLSRYPLLFSFLSVFGIISILYGFESLISRVPFLANHPLLVLFVGIVILIFTGALYKSLERCNVTQVPHLKIIFSPIVT